MSAASDQAEQLAFAQALRDSAAAAPAWIAARPLQIYRELAFNNLQRALARSFAVSHSLLSEARWNALVGAFFKTLRTREPQLRRLPAEFTRWLADEAPREAPAWWLALCRYEQIELELAMADIELPDAPAPQGEALALQLLDGRPQLSPLARLFESEWPVHRIDAAFAAATPDDAQPATDQRTRLVIWRDRADSVRFIELNALSARLLQALRDSPTRSGREHLRQLAAELSQAPEPLIEAGAQLLSSLYSREIVLLG